MSPSAHAATPALPAAAAEAAGPATIRRQRRLDRGAAGGIAAAVVLAAVTRIPLLVGPPRDYDEGVYWMSVRLLDRGHALYGEVYSSQPPAFLPLLHPFFDAFGRSLTSLRVGVLLVTVAGLAAGALGAWRLAGRLAAAAVAALLLLDPELLRASVSVQSEGPALSLALVAVALAAAAGPPRHAPPGVARPGRPEGMPMRRAVLLAGAAGAVLALAIEVKLLAAPAAVAVVVLLAAPGGPGRPATRLAGAGAGLAAVAGITALLLRDDLGAVVRQSVGLHVSAQAVMLGGLTDDMRTELVRDSPVLLAGVLGLGALLRLGRLRLAAALGGWMAAAGLALALQHPLWPHHLTGLAAPAALCGGVGLALGAARGAARAGSGRPARALAAACAGILATAAAVGAVSGGRAAAAGSPPVPTAGQVARLRAAVPAGAVVVTDDQVLAAAAGLLTPAGLCDTSLVRVLSGDLDAAAVEAAAERDGAAGVLLATGRLDRVEGLSAWVSTHYPRTVGLGEGVILHLP